MSVQILIGDALWTGSGSCPMPRCIAASRRRRTGACGRTLAIAGMIGLEPTFAEHLDNLVAVFREVRRVLRDDGVLFLNYGGTAYGRRTAQQRRRHRSRRLGGSPRT